TVLIDYLGGDALRDLVRTRAGSRRIQSLVGVRMNVNETRRDVIALRVDHAPGRRPRQFADRRDPSIFDCDVGGKPWVPRPVRDAPASNQQVIALLLCKTAETQRAKDKTHKGYYRDA